ncbi:regulator of G-protein signaling 13 isoform X1 [Oryx dammah]|uniref:regulator of G-protein signaling 13 isoform X1 n=2 Tax=Oryx dammah TaxID=59534 RepID=UPI001A9BF25B|nr:regulator of G-protein signaling 13 isoform X1 [Oryx dammah]XP_040118820.1 regulator of G-protein signaling 13 isoform X1 [Oryx dammah]
MEFFHISYHHYEKKMIIVDVKLDEVPKSAFSIPLLEIKPGLTKVYLNFKVKVTLTGVGKVRKMSRRNCWICKMCRDESKRPPSNLTLEEVLQWAQSFETLMATKYGPVVYAAYLKTEHSDENIKFWKACETYKKTASQWSRTSRAKKLYKVYIQPQSPREINIDSSTREAIIKNIQEPTQTCFEEAQKIVYMHMERDSYPRFLKSEMYQKLLKTIQANNNP